MKIGVLTLVTLVGTLSLGCSKQEPRASGSQDAPDSPAVAPSSRQDAVRLSASSSKLVGLKVDKAKTQEVRSVLRVMGKILACKMRTSIVSHPFPARVAAIHVKLGDWVEQNQSLVTLESREVGNAISEYYKALASLELAKLSLDREQRLRDEGFGVKKNLVAAEVDYKIAQTNSEAAEKALHVLGFTEKQVESIRRTHQINPAITLYASLPGKVVVLKAVQGSFVDQGAEILTISDPKLLWADAEVYEKDIAKVKVGQEVEIAVPAYPGETFRGKTTYIADMVDPETRTITVRSELSNSDRRLKCGMFADLTLILDPGEKLVVIPSAAVLDKGGRKIVFVKEKDDLVRREIETRPPEGDMQPVVKGLAPGEEVVVQGNHELKSLLERDILLAAEVH